MKRIALASFALSSCVFTVAEKDRAMPVKPSLPVTASEVYASTAIETDTYKRTTSVTGPTMDVPISIAPVGSHFHLRAIWKDGEHLATQLYVNDIGFRWRFLENANDQSGASLRAERVATDVILGLCHEHVLVWMPDGYLEGHADSGLSLKLWGSSGEQIIPVPGFYVQGFLRKLEEHESKAARPAPASTP